MFGNNSFGSTSFGGTTFGSGFGGTPTLGAFGSTTQPNTQPAGPIGTTIRFVPLNGQDTVQRTGANAGGPSQITTRHQNISAMKEYESKSVEELRLEDYAANRKVGQPQTGFTTTPFTSMQPSTSQQTGSLFGSNNQTTPNLFSSPFGQAKTGFEMNNTSNIFNTANKPNTTVSNSPFSIGTQSNPVSTTPAQTGFSSIFNTNNNQQTTAPFGQSAVSSPFKPNLFATPAPNTGSIFNTNTNTSASSFLGQNTANNQQQTPFGGNTSLFAPTSQPTPNLFSTPTQNQTQNLFGTKTGFELNSSSSIFNSAASKPSTTVASSPFNMGFTPTPFTSMQPSTSQQTGSLFGSNNQTTPNLFSSPFGQAKTGFEMNSTSNIFNTANKPNTTVSNSPFSIGTQSNPASTTPAQTGFSSIFNTNNNQQTTAPLGQTAANSPFKPNLFATPAPNTGSIFNTNTNTSASSFLGQNTANNQQQTPFGGNTSLFAPTSQPASNLFSTPTQNLFGAKTGFELNSGLNSGFQQQPTFGMPTNITQQPTQTPDLQTRFKILPYGESSLFLNQESNSELGPLKFATDLKNKNNYKINKKTDIKLSKPASSEKISVLFDDLDDNKNDDLKCAIDVFIPKKSVKKLNLKPNSHLSDGDAEHSSDSPLFERTRSGTASRSFRENTADSVNASSSRHIRFADETFPGSDANGSYISNLSHTSSNRSGLSSFQLNSQMSINSKSGIINSRPDYHIKPSFDEIERRYNSENDSCYVDSFSIERPNYGSILFDSPLDVKGLNLDEIVHIRRKEVVVYPDDENKPPIGQGLNRPAVVTLHQVWPVDKSNNQIIRDVDRLNTMKYPEKIESATTDKGARFIEYIPETGSWVFRVKHFSKYGITDDDEDIVPIQQQQQQQHQQHSPQQPSPRQQQPPRQHSPVLLPLQQQILQRQPLQQQPQQQQQQVSVPQKSPSPSVGFKMSAKTTVTLNKPSTPVFEDGPNQSIRKAIEELFESEDDKPSFNVHRTKRLALQNVNMSPTIIHGPSVPKQQKVRDLKMQPDLSSARNKLIRDINSVCAAGAPKVRFSNGSRKFCCIQGDTVIVHELKLVPTLDQMLPRFESFLEKDSIITSLNMTPILAPYIETLDFISDATSYDLLHALYGSLNSKTPYAKQDERLNRVITWLATVNRKIPPPKNLYQLIVYHMSCDRYDLASSIAIENNHPRLALLLATLNLNKDLMYEQLSSWRLSHADQYIDPELLRIYILLSGYSEWKLSNDVTIYCLKGLEWTQQLCLLALHVTSHIIEPEKYGFHMLPLHIKRLDTKTDDVEYHILARHSPARILSAAKSLIEEWFLLESLKSFHVINSESECINSDIIHSNMASQLGPIDLRWACFVTLHIINNEIRNQTLIKCLEQNHDQLKDEKLGTWLVEKLKIPLGFINQ